MLKTNEKLIDFVKYGKKYQFAIDTSGSQDQKGLEEYVHIIKRLYKEKNLQNSVILMFDHNVFAPITVEEFDLKHLQGGGGSKLDPVFEAYDESFEGLVVFTDGYTNLGLERPNFPFLICFETEIGKNYCTSTSKDLKEQDFTIIG